MYKCCKCNKEFNLKGSKTNHEKNCDGIGTGIKRRREKNKKCSKCGKEIKSQGFKKHYNYCDGTGILNSKRYTGRGCDWEKGKTFIELYGKKRAEEIGNKISKTLTGKSKGIGSTPEKEIQRRNKITTALNEKYKNGWDPKCGRCLKYDYESPIAGKIKVDGKWELAIAKYLDTISVKWERNKKRFEYINLYGKLATYRPDFYIYDWNSYLEIKGYETKLDKCKWSQFNHPLIIWRKKEMKELNLI